MQNFKKYLIITMVLMGVLQTLYAEDKVQSIDIDNFFIKPKLQKIIKEDTDAFKKEHDIKEVIISIMDNKTGKVLSLVSSNTKTNQVSNNFTKPYILGNLLQPFIIARALQDGKIQESDHFYIYNEGDVNIKGEFPEGKYVIGRRYMTESKKYTKNYLTIEDILKLSSNIGITQVANRYSEKDFYESVEKLKSFDKDMDINTSKSNIRQMPPKRLFASKEGKKGNYKTLLSTGMAVRLGFFQIMKTFSTFSDDGYAITPRIFSKKRKKEKLFSNDTVNIVKNILIENTKEYINFENLQVGQKSTIIHVEKDGKYISKYIVTTFGFVSDKNNSYTIGVSSYYIPNINHKYSRDMFKKVV